MTDEKLRDLLEERVAHVTGRDLSGSAWRTGRRARRRSRQRALGAAGVVVAAVGTVALLLGQDGRSSGPSPAPSVPTATADVEGEPDATYQGVPVFWSLGQEQEVSLPYVDRASLPPVIDLRSGPIVTSMDHAIAAFAVAGSVRLVDEDGGQLVLDISRLGDVVKSNGYGYAPVHASMLSPSGRYLVFPQNDSLEVYAVASGEWLSIDTGGAVTRFVTWASQDLLVLPPTEGGGQGPGYTLDGGRVSDVGVTRLRPLFGVGDAQAFGPTRSAGDARAQSYGMGLPIPVAAGTYLSNPEFIYAQVGAAPSVLSIMWNLRNGDHGGRFLQCCPVAGWLDGRTLVYESRQAQSALVAWTVGTDDFALVSRIEGQYLVASYADLG